MPARKRQVSIPKVNVNNIRLPFPINTVSILVILMIIAAFLIGVLITKVSYLEKGVGTAATTTIAGDDATSESVTVGPPVNVDPGALPSLGNKDAKVKLIEFSDFQCPFCKSFFEDTLISLKKEFIDTGIASFNYRHFPLSSIHPNAQKAAEASECANEQGNFWGYHDELFKTQSSWETLSGDNLTDKFAEIAASINLDGATLKSCVESDKFADTVKKDESDGSAVGVQGTPATFINGYLVSGACPIDTFREGIKLAQEGKDFAVDSSCQVVTE